MEAVSRHLGRGSATRQRPLVFAAAALLTALLFAGLFEGTAHLTNWILTDGFERFERLHPALHPWIAVIVPLLWFLFCAAIGVGGYRRTRRRARLQAHRRPPRF